MFSVIVNPSSGGGRCGSLLPAVEAELVRRGLEYRVTLTRSIEHAGELAQAAAATGETPIAFGGDGLVGAVAAALAGSGAAFGLLPGGRGNDFARAIGESTDPVEAIETIATGTSVPIDLGQAGEQTYLGIASCGFDSEANKIANETTFLKGNLVYTYAGVRALIDWRPADFQLTLDGVQREMRGYTVAVANSSIYGGGMRIAPHADLRDGLFDVVLITDAPRLQFLMNLPKVFSGAHVTLPNVEVLRAREVRIEASRPFALYADGDPTGQLPIDLRVLEHAVEVIAPRGGPLGGGLAA